MAKAPAGPIGNSPRDMRDDAVGVPAENVKAPAPPRWPPKRKKITSNTFHAKVSGGSSAKRADRPPHYRRGGMVSPRAAGGPVEDKNDPGDLGKKGLKQGGAVAKRQEGGPTDGIEEERRGGLKKLSGAMEKESAPLSNPRPFTRPRTATSNVSRYVRPGLSEERGGYKSGGVTKRADGGDAGLRSESTETAKAWNKLEKTPRTGPEPDTSEKILQNTRNLIRTKKETGYKDGGKLSAAQRQSLPKSDFALPGAGEGPKGAGSGSYPIPDESHAKNALARSSGKPEAAEVRRKVEAKYPGMGKE